MKLAVRVTPRAARDRIDGLAAGPDGRAVLKLGVTAPPEDGKANAAVLKLLAKALRLPKTSLSVVAGATGRSKTVLLSGEPERLAAALRDRLGKEAA